MTHPAPSHPAPSRPGPDLPTSHRPAPIRDRVPGERPDERGITTAEYAVGTAAGAGFAALLYKMLSGGFGDDLLTKLFDHVMSLLGIG